MSLNVPPWLFAKWMRAAKEDPAIKPARVLYAGMASHREQVQLKVRRQLAARLGRTLRAVHQE